MKVFFIGCVDFSEKMFQVLLEMNGIEIVGLATKSKSNFNSDHSDLSVLAKSNNIPYKYVKSINAPHIIDWIKESDPFVIFCFGWSEIIGKDLLSIPKYGIVGYHPSKLPYNRGRHPIIWALALGLESTGSTFFLMDERADTGKIIDQETVLIESNDDANSLYKKITLTARNQLKIWIPKLLSGDLILKNQNLEESNTWRKRSISDGLIDFRMSSNSIFNLVRALTKPYVGAHISYEGGEIKVWECKIGPIFPKNFEPGRVMKVEDNFITVKTGDGSIVFNDISLSKRIKPGDYLL